MQGVLLLCGLWLTARGARRHARDTARILCALLALCMGGQLWALWRMDALTVQAALPLHLCGAFAVLCVPMALLRLRPLYDLTWLLGAPCALLALLFPAVVPARDALVMTLSFYGVHALILCCALLLRLETGWPLPQSGRGALLWLNAFALLAQAVNRRLSCNYLFLRVAPQKTPLAFLQAQGQAVYIFSLELAAMLLLCFLPALYRRVNSGNRPPHSPSRRHSSPPPSPYRE